MDTLDTPSNRPPVQPFTNTILRYGAFSGLASIVSFLVFYLANVSMVSIAGSIMQGLVGIGLSVLFVVLAIRHQRDTLEGGVLSFGRAFLVGAGVIFVSMLLMSVWNYIFFNFIDTEFISKMISDFNDTWGESLPADKLEETNQKFEEMGTLPGILKGTMINGSIGAIIIGLITGAIMKKEPKD